MFITNSPTAGAPLADLPEAIRTLSEISAQANERVATLSRAALHTGMRLAEQNAEHAEQWAKVLVENAQRLAAMTRAAEVSAKNAQGLPQLWALEVQWMNDTARATTSLSQDIWQALMQTHTNLAKAMVTQSTENFQHTLQAFNGNGAKREFVHPDAPTKPLDISTYGFAPLINWMTQATHAMSRAAVSAAETATAGASDREHRAAVRSGRRPASTQRD